MSLNLNACVFCGTGTDNHRPCIEAYGLDHDPISPEKAQEWLDRRRELLGV